MKFLNKKAFQASLDNPGTGLWTKGPYFDIWHIPHFLFGVNVGFGLVHWSVTLRNGLIILLTIKVMWELFENALMKNKETLFNSTFDILFGLLGCICAYVFYPLLTMRQFWPTLIFLTIFWLGLDIFGALRRIAHFDT